MISFARSGINTQFAMRGNALWCACDMVRCHGLVYGSYDHCDLVYQCNTYFRATNVWGRLPVLSFKRWSVMWPSVHQGHMMYVPSPACCMFKENTWPLQSSCLKKLFDRCAQVVTLGRWEGGHYIQAKLVLLSRKRKGALVTWRCLLFLIAVTGIIRNLHDRFPSESARTVFSRVLFHLDRPFVKLTISLSFTTLPHL